MKQSLPKILVVDDNVANRALYCEWIKSVGNVEVHEARGGQEAIEMANRNEFAMIVLDVNMPDMDGFETAAILRQDPQPHQAPIVFISGEFDRNQRVRGYRMGAVDCLVTEPLDPEILAQKARVFIQLHRKHQELQAALELTRKDNAALHTRLANYVDEQHKLKPGGTLDPLTGIPGRAIFDDRLQGAVKRAERSRRHFALAHVGLDEATAIAERHGRPTGDELIKSVAQRLHRGIRATDTVARLGAHEFGLLFEGLDSGSTAEYLGAKLNRLLLLPVQLSADTGGRLLKLTLNASVGVAMYPDHGRSSEALLRQAGLAMRAVQGSGGGTRVYDRTLATVGAAGGDGQSMV